MSDRAYRQFITRRGYTPAQVARKMAHRKRMRELWNKIDAATNAGSTVIEFEGETLQLVDLRPQEQQHLILSRSNTNELATAAI